MTTATKKRTPMTPTEALAEVDWLVGGGMHVDLIVESMGRTRQALEGLARRQGRQDLARIFKKPGNCTK